MWHIGQKVVCVDDAFHPLQGLYLRNLPARGQIYTVRGAKRNGALVVEELVNPPIPRRLADGRVIQEEPHWHRLRFRPAQERSAGMDVLRGILSGNDPEGETPGDIVREPETVGDDELVEEDA